MTNEEITKIAAKEFPYVDPLSRELMDTYRSIYLAGAQHVLSQQAKGKEEIRKEFMERALNHNENVDWESIWSFFEPHLNTQKEEWVDVNFIKPCIHQPCAFIVESTNDSFYNGKVYGGNYQGNDMGYHEFSIPGISWKATLWQPLPPPPSK